MHMQLLRNNKVVLFDRTDMGPSNASFFPFGSSVVHDPCRLYSVGNTTVRDCTLHSLLYDVSSDTFRPLYVDSDTWCSSGFTRAFPTELSLEAYLPPYLGPTKAVLRPTIIFIEARENTVSYGGLFAVNIGLSVYRPEGEVHVALVAPSFTTHSLAMNQRVVVLEVASLQRLSVFDYKVIARGPPNANVAPPGYYMVFIVHAGIPGQALWLRVM